MTYFNRSADEFMPVGRGPFNPTDENQPEAPALLRNGLYYRTRVFPELVTLVDACQRGQMSYDELPLDALQSWNETGWKEPHVSHEAVVRFGAKITEEATEVIDAADEYFETQDSAHLVEELGDYQWTATALIGNAGVVVGDSIARRLFDYAKGTRVWSSQGAISYPKWYDVATGIAVKRGPITIGDLDDLIKVGFVPQGSIAMNQDEHEQVSPTYFANDCLMLGRMLTLLCERQFDSNRHPSIYGLDFKAEADDVGKIAAEIYLRTAAVAAYVGTDLAHVASVNVDKISGRIVTNTVDKLERP